MSHTLPDLGPVFAGRYRFERFLARGGMADVYLGHDLRHDRPVALKLLRREYAASILAERFLREIHYIARLVHPHILQVLDSGEDGGVLWYAMPFVEDETLEARMRRGEVPLREALTITAEIADALGHAHAHGVVHRDIKPGNILLSGGHGVLADFGIARSMDTHAEARISQVGFLIGTPQYMSPEQCAGEQHIDGRSDIYSLGCVLFELVAGRPPFGGRSPKEIFAGHISAPAPEVRDLIDKVPDAVNELLLRTLAKAPDDRYQSAAEVAQALRAAAEALPRVTPTRLPRLGRRRRPWLWAAIAGGVVLVAATAALLSRAPGATPPRERLAVLYLRDLSPDGRWQSQADLLTEDLIDRLSGVPALGVLSAGSVRPLRGREVSFDSLRRRGVGAVVDGTLTPVGDSMRLALRLVDAASGDQLSSFTVTALPAATFGLRDSLVDAATAALRLRLGRELRAQQLRTGTRNAEAWRLMEEAEALRRRHWVTYGRGAGSEARDAIRRADSLFGAAARADPGWPAPLLSQGLTAQWLARSLLPDRGAAGALLRTGLRRIDAALALRPRDPEAIALRGTLRFELCCVVSDPPLNPIRAQAEADLLEATRADPDLARAWMVLSLIYQQTGRPTEAANAARAAYDRDLYLDDPPGALTRLLFALLDAAQYVEADRRCREGQTRFPEDLRFAECRLIVWGSAATTAAQVDSSWRELARVEASPNVLDYPGARSLRRAWLAMQLARLGQADSARRVLARLQAAEPSPAARATLDLPVAYVWLLLGRRDSAVARLAESVAEDHTDPAVIERSPWFNGLRGDPRFEALVREGAASQ